MTPLMVGDHPESDLSEFCNQDQIKQTISINCWTTDLAFWTGEILIENAQRHFQGSWFGLL